MCVPEPARLALESHLGEAAGSDNAETPMRSGFDEIHRALRQQMVTTIGAITALTGIFALFVGLLT